MTRFNSRSRWLVPLLVAACGGAGTEDDGGGGGGGGTPDASSGEALVNGVPASQYYGQFAHATTMTHVEGAVAFTMTGGKNAFLAQFFLMPGGALQLFYEEGSGTVSSTGWSLNTDPATKKKLTGTWRIEGATLVLDSYMSCDGVTFNSKPALHCTLDAAIVTSAAVGRSGTFKTDPFGPTSPDDTEFASYQP